MSLKIFENPVEAPIQFIDSFQNNVQVYLKREDMIHPLVSGNKWRKLRYNLMEARKLGLRQLITFGGAYSNHLHATAAAGALCDFQTVGIVRGEIIKPLNSTLQQVVDWGMKLIPVDRATYKEKDSLLIRGIISQLGGGYVIPEGGSNLLALKGCREITDIDRTFDYWCLSCGTGGTMAGILSGLGSETTVLGFPALKGGLFMKDAISQLLERGQVSSEASWELIPDYHFGGYARITEELINFILDFSKKYQILLDPVYTGKMMYGLLDLVDRGFFPKNSSILCLHTGGLQGIAGIEKKYGIEIK